MIINDDKNFVFTCIAKTGSTSIRRMLGSMDDPPPGDYHISLSDAMTKTPQIINYRKLAFVRNPYDRLFSCYSNFKYDGHLWEKQIKKTRDFKDFVLNLEESNLYDNLIHLRPQFDYVQIDGIVKLDFLGRFENFEQDCKKMFDYLNLNYGSKIIKTRVSSKREVKKYTTEMKDIVRRVYKNDFEVFNYEQ